MVRKLGRSLQSVKMRVGIRSQQMREDDSAGHRSAAAGPRHSGHKINHIQFAAGFVFLLALGSEPAAARPQDEVLSGAFRCAAIGELRTWLDCYYGAAQPQRLSLGLPPVPAAQARLVAAPPAGSREVDTGPNSEPLSFERRGQCSADNRLSCRPPDIAARDRTSRFSQLSL